MDSKAFFLESQFIHTIVRQRQANIKHMNSITRKREVLTEIIHFMVKNGLLKLNLEIELHSRPQKYKKLYSHSDRVIHTSNKWWFFIFFIWKIRKKNNIIFLLIKHFYLKTINNISWKIFLYLGHSTLLWLYDSALYSHKLMIFDSRNISLVAGQLWVRSEGLASGRYYLERFFSSYMKIDWIQIKIVEEEDK